MSRRFVTGLWLAGTAAWALLIGLDIADVIDPSALLLVAMAGLLFLVGNAIHADPRRRSRGGSAR